MDYCQICSGVQFDPGYEGGLWICARCYNGAKSLRAGLEKLKPDLCKSNTNGVSFTQYGPVPQYQYGPRPLPIGNPITVESQFRYLPYSNWSGVPIINKNPMGVFENALKCLEAVKESEEQLRFVGGYSDAYRNQIHCDIKLKPGDNGPPIPAHRSLLATRSDIFKNVLDSDGCKASVPDETITLAEMSYLELESFLEFLYNGELPKAKMEKNVNALTRAAHKYQIPFLAKYCEKQMCSTLNLSNVLDILEISDSCCSENLKGTALNFISEHMEEIVFSDKFDAFALKNPQLTAELTRLSTTTKNRKIINQDDGPNKFPRFN